MLTKHYFTCNQYIVMINMQEVEYNDTIEAPIWNSQSAPRVWRKIGWEDDNSGEQRIGI